MAHQEVDARSSIGRPARSSRLPGQGPTSPSAMPLPSGHSSQGEVQVPQGLDDPRAQMSVQRRAQTSGTVQVASHEEQGASHVWPQPTPQVQEVSNRIGMAQESAPLGSVEEVPPGSMGRTPQGYSQVDQNRMPSTDTGSATGVQGGTLRSPPVKAPPVVPSGLRAPPPPPVGYNIVQGILVRAKPSPPDLPLSPGGVGTGATGRGQVPIKAPPKAPRLSPQQGQGQLDTQVASVTTD